MNSLKKILSCYLLIAALAAPSIASAAECVCIRVCCWHLQCWCNE